MTMDIQQLLCDEFCGALTVRKVPVGYAVGTGYDGPEGDPLGFFVVGPDASGKFRVEDDGLSIALIESHGVDLSSKTRGEAFRSLMDEYNVLFDDDTGELGTEPILESQLANVAMRFVAFLLRVQDLVLLSQERVASTFREDATNLIREKIGSRAEILEEHIINQELGEYAADIAIYAPGRPPVALFFGTSDAHIYEALLLQSYAENKEIPCSVVTMIETQRSISQKAFVRANNHLDAVPIFRGTEDDAIGRLSKEVFGTSSLH
tara:strand:+ start:84265 stop:85056 length:792 start_codon:yes stop_codon:yes gene_type:complete